MTYKLRAKNIVKLKSPPLLYEKSIYTTKAVFPRRCLQNICSTLTLFISYIFGCTISPYYLWQ